MVTLEQDASRGQCVMARFRDGPLSGKGNVSNAGGGLDFLLSVAVYGWPLPDRMRVLTHAGVENVAMWDADGDGAGLPEQIVHSRNAVTYRKISESQIPDEAAAAMTHVVRGAVYVVES